MLVVGPTGSGKSTTLAAMIDRINSTRPVHILTIEDPVEYLHHHKVAMINQREVGTDVETFEAGLKSALREDPDVVLLGEMRDLESISISLSLAETGHLVFATLHTNDAAQALDRIIDVFPSERRDQIQIMLAGALQGVISQRLLPSIGGGRVASYEVMMANEAIRNLVREGKSRQMRNMIATGCSRRHADDRDGPRPTRGGRPDLDGDRDGVEPVPEGDPGAADDGSRSAPGAGDDVDRPGRLVGRRHLRRRAGAGAARPARVRRLTHGRQEAARSRTSPGSRRAPAGWLVLPGTSGRRSPCRREEAFVVKRLFEVLDYRPAFEAAAINAPMGLFDLPSGQFRPCDHESREYVGWPRSVAIGGIPCRTALTAASNAEAQRLEPWMTKHDLRRLRWLREAERELQPFHAAQLVLGQPRRVVHGDEQRRAVEDLAVPRGRTQGAAAS